jgi:hypothetical protein
MRTSLSELGYLCADLIKFIHDLILLKILFNREEADFKESRVLSLSKAVSMSIPALSRSFETRLFKITLMADSEEISSSSSLRSVQKPPWQFPHSYHPAEGYLFKRYPQLSEEHDAL